MKEEESIYTFDRVVRGGITIFSLVIIIWILNYLSDVLIPFALSILLAYLINPMVNIVEKNLRSRVLSVVVSLFIVIIILATFFITITPLISSELRHVGFVFKELLNNSDLTQKAITRLPPDYWKAIQKLISNKEVQNFVNTTSFMSLIQNILKKLLPGMWNMVKGSTSLIFWLVGFSIIFLYLFFLLIEYEDFKENWSNLIPNNYKEIVKEFVKDFDDSMNRYFRAQALVAFITGILFSIGFLIIGMPMAIFLGLFLGILNMIPYLQIFGLLPTIILAIVRAIETNGSIGNMIGLTILVFVVVQLIQDSIVVPKIMGNATGLSPVMILLSLSIWGKLLGMLGLLIALPMTCLFLAYYERFLEKINKVNSKIQIPKKK